MAHGRTRRVRQRREAENPIQSQVKINTDQVASVAAQAAISGITAAIVTKALQDTPLDTDGKS